MVQDSSGEIIGAIGLCGSSVENDHEVATYAANNVNKIIKAA